MKPWTKQKPTKPGRYQVWNLQNNTIDVEVRREGRGLVVYVPQYHDTIPMSDIGDDEFEWREME